MNTTPPYPFFCQSDLLIDRGWSTQLIADLLGEADFVFLMPDEFSPFLFARDRVLAAEQSPIFRKHAEQQAEAEALWQAQQKQAAEFAQTSPIEVTFAADAELKAKATKKEKLGLREKTGRNLVRLNIKIVRREFTNEAALFDHLLALPGFTPEKWIVLRARILVEVGARYDKLAEECSAMKNERVRFPEIFK